MPDKQSRPIRDKRLALRLTAAEKALLARAAAIEILDLSSFVLRAAVPVAAAVVARTERRVLSERDSLQVLALLEQPPAPTAALAAAASAWLKNQQNLNR